MRTASAYPNSASGLGNKALSETGRRRAGTRDSSRGNRADIAAVILGLCCVAPAFAQNADRGAGAPSYINKEQIEAARALVGETPGLGLVHEVSMLLAHPCDRVNWLLSIAEDLRNGGEINQRTREEAKQVLDDMVNMSDSPDDRIGSCEQNRQRLVEVLREISQPKRQLWEITDPSELVQEITNRGSSVADGLTIEQKLILAARGVPVARLGIDARVGVAGPTETIPFRAVVALAGEATVPKFDRLLPIDQLLSRGWQLWRDGGNTSSEFPVEDTFVIARVLVDRAMGVDGDDCPKDADRRAAHDADWASLASKFESQNLWLWASFARILEAGETGTAASAAGAAESQWQKATGVSAALSGVMPAGEMPAGVGDGSQAWIARLKSGQTNGSAGVIPLRSDFRVAARQRRGEFEQAFLSAANRGDVDRAFAAMQQAKAADLGLDARSFQPIALSAMRDNLKVPAPRGDKMEVIVNLFVEAIEVRPEGGASRFYGVVLKAADPYRDTDEYKSEIVGSASSIVALMGMVLPNGALEGQKPEDARILIAPDGALDDEWFTYELGTLIPLVRGSEGWLCYMPSGGVLSGRSPWGLDATAAAWYRNAQRIEKPELQTIGFYLTRTGSEPQGIPKTLSGGLSGLPIHAISFGRFEVGRRISPQAMFGRLKSTKESDGAAPAMLILTTPQ